MVFHWLRNKRNGKHLSYTQLSLRASVWRVSGHMACSFCHTPMPDMYPLLTHPWIIFRMFLVEVKIFSSHFLCRKTAVKLCYLKVHLTAKYLFLLKQIFVPIRNTLCHFKQNFHFLQAVKVTKSSHHLFHDRASIGMGLLLVWRQTTTTTTNKDWFTSYLVFVNMHAKKFVTSNRKWIHTSYLLGRGADDGQIL